MHIPRSGGTTFWRFAQKVYDDAVTHGPGPAFGRRHGQMCREMNNNTKCYIAHMSYDPGLPELDWVTVIQEPIRRMVSHFYFKVHRELSEYVGLDIWDITNDRDWRQHHFSRDCGFNLMTRMFASGHDILGDALRHARRFRLIGHVNRYQQFIDRFANKFDVTTLPIWNDNAIHNQPDLKDLPPDCLAWLREHNQADIELVKCLQEEGLVA